jgi:hypothetical protein
MFKNHNKQSEQAFRTGKTEFRLDCTDFESTQWSCVAPEHFPALLVSELYSDK